MYRQCNSVSGKVIGELNSNTDRVPCVYFRTSILGLDTHPSFLITQEGWLGSFALRCQLVWKEEVSRFKICLKIDRLGLDTLLHYEWCVYGMWCSYDPSGLRDSWPVNVFKVTTPGSEFEPSITHEGFWVSRNLCWSIVVTKVQQITNVFVFPFRN